MSLTDAPYYGTEFKKNENFKFQDIKVELLVVQKS